MFYTAVIQKNIFRRENVMNIFVFQVSYKNMIKEILRKIFWMSEFKLYKQTDNSFPPYLTEPFLQTPRVVIFF